jgi:hypothetical protein
MESSQESPNSMDSLTETLELTPDQKLQVRDLQLQISQAANIQLQLIIQHRDAEKAQKEAEEKLQKMLDGLRPGPDYDIQNDLRWVQRPAGPTLISPEPA